VILRFFTPGATCCTNWGEIGMVELNYARFHLCQYGGGDVQPKKLKLKKNSSHLWNINAPEGVSLARFLLDFLGLWTALFGVSC